MRDDVPRVRVRVRVWVLKEAAFGSTHVRWWGGSKGDMGLRQRLGRGAAEDVGIGVANGVGSSAWSGVEKVG